MTEDTPGGGFTWQQVKRLRELKEGYSERGRDDEFNEPQEVINRWKFEKWRLEQNPEDNTPVMPNPFPPDRRITTVDPKSQQSMGEFMDRHRRKKK